MNKKILAGLLLSVLGMASAHAADVTANVGATSDYLYRGASLTEGKPTVFGSLTFNDVLVKGVSVDVSGVVLDASPYNSTKTVRSELGVGYTHNFTDSVSVYGGVTHVTNPVEYSHDYNEVRSNVDWKISDKLSVFGKGAYIMGDAVPNDTYVAAGVKYDGVFTDKLSVSALTSSLRSDSDSKWMYNNLEVSAEYSITDSLSAFGTYSVGGDAVLRGVDGFSKFSTTSLPSGGFVGVKYKFN